jgi:hypothetical protein
MSRRSRSTSRGSRRRRWSRCWFMRRSGRAMP